MSRPTAMILMFGYSDANDVRRLVQQARLAATEDLLLRTRACSFDRIIFCSNRPDALVAEGLPVERVTDFDQPFHFGRELQSLVRRCHLEDYALLYVGGGLPLLSASTLAQMLAFLAGGDGRAVANNLHSCDFVGWTPGSAVLDITPPDTDNDLAWQLRRAGAEMSELPRSAETIFDIDTPTDLALLHLTTGLGPNLSRLLARTPVDQQRQQDTLKVLRSWEGSALCYGRISHHAWAYFAQGVACQTRIISEERSMRASGRLARGEVRSLLGLLADQVGFPAMFATLAQLAGALLLDTRVIMAHHRQWPRVEDRFHSDLGQVDAIEDAWLRQMTQAALECGVPVLMGGHCLVSGGLYLLADAVGPKEYPW
ncbi:MAG: hypothetical protein ACUVWR_03590 [Anaerolineae bacterium]